MILPRQFDQLQALYDMGQVVTSSLNLETVFQKVLEQVIQVVGATGASVLLLEENRATGTPELKFVATCGQDSQNLLNQLVPLKSSIAGQVLQTGVAAVISDAVSSEDVYRFSANKSHAPNVGSLLAVPLVLEGKNLGVMEAVHTQAHKFDDGDLKLLETAASWASIAIGNARQHADLQRRLRENQTIQAITRSLNETLELNQILHQITEAARQIIPNVTNAMIHLLDDKAQFLHAAALSTPTKPLDFDAAKPQLVMRAGEGIAGMALAQDHPINIGDVTAEAVYVKTISAPAKRSLMVTPISRQQQRFGTLSVTALAPYAFSDDDMRLLQLLGMIAAAAIERAQLFEVERQKREQAVEMQSLAQEAARQAAVALENERKANEIELARQAAEATSRAKSEFLSNMSHELRTPMNAILGLTHLILKTDLTHQQLDYLTKVQTSAYTLHRIIQDILDFSAIESDRLEIEATPFQPDKVIENLTAGTREQAEKKGLHISYEMAADIPLTLIGDSLRLGQILRQLTENAIKFTEHGEIQVTATCGSQQQITEQSSLVWLRFCVRDTGIGMDTDEVARLYQPFTQGDSSSTRKHGGAGLGLAISQRLASLMGGHIEVESAPGKGSTFTLSLPFHCYQERHRYSISPPATGKSRALVVDHDPLCVTLLENILQALSFGVSCVATGLQALAELERAHQAGEPPYDLVLLDWKIPEMDGLEVARSIQSNSLLPQIPMLIMTTTYGEENLSRQVKEMQLDGFLVKPITSSMLLDAITDATQRRKASTMPFVEGATANNIVEDSSLDGKHILLVEDHPASRQIMSKVIQRMGFRVSTANNGQEAVQWIKQAEHRPDLVLMDVQMPVMDGYQATRAIRSDPVGCNLPIIALTAQSGPEARQKSLEAGMNDHLTKPIQPGDLKTSLVRWLTPLTKAPEKRISLPPLAGIDTDDGLERLGGNAATYQQILGKFIFHHQNDGALIRQALAANHFSEALLLAHTLKGTAGTIGALALQTSAKQLEMAIRSENADLTSACNQVEAALSEVVQSIQGLQAVATERSIPTTQTIEYAPGEPETVALLAELRQHLLEHDAAAPDTIRRLRQHGYCTSGDTFSLIETDLQHYDFENALLKLDRCISENQVS
jgi:signal transduction histidine kinase/DNA-binding response OmpR family regulator/HPt (histidine-containing phosphotransfer) domain-containing protein